MANNTSISFYKGESFSSYETGAVYFETSTHLIKVATSATDADVYCGVRSASLDATTKILTIVNESGTSIQLNFSDIASATTLSTLLENVGDVSKLTTTDKTIVGAINELNETLDDSVSDIEKKSISEENQYYLAPVCTSYQAFDNYGEEYGNSVFTFWKSRATGYVSEKDLEGIFEDGAELSSYSVGIVSALSTATSSSEIAEHYVNSQKTYVGVTSVVVPDDSQKRRYIVLDNGRYIVYNGLRDRTNDTDESTLRYKYTDAVSYDALQISYNDGTTKNIELPEEITEDAISNMGFIKEDLSGLNTTNKTVVGAINEINTSMAPIIISVEMVEDPDVIKGVQGETTHTWSLSGDAYFYEITQALEGETCEQYHSRLSNNLVLINGGGGDSWGPFISVPYIERNDTNKITLTAHIHFWQERNDDLISNNVADLIVVINFEDLSVGFVLTQWTLDEMHVASPHKIIIDMASEKNDADELLISMSLKNILGEPVTSKYVIDLLKEGKNVIFGSLDDDKWEGANCQYDLWAYSDNQLVVRWANMDKSNSGGYYTHSYSILVFDINGEVKYNNNTGAPIKGCVYYYKPIQRVQGDDYVSAEISYNDSHLHTLKLTTNVSSISDATESTTGLAKAYDVKEYVRTQIAGAQNSYELVLNEDGSVECIKNGTDEGFVLNSDGSVSLG